MAKEPVCMCGHGEGLHYDNNPLHGCTRCTCGTFTDKRISARRAASKSTREAGPKSDIIKLLEERGIRFFRLNSFDAVYRNNGRKYRIIGNKPGTPDIMCLIPANTGSALDSYWILWVEAKSKSGKLRPEQIEFQNSCEKICETYLLARSVQDVENWLKENS